MLLHYLISLVASFFIDNSAARIYQPELLAWPDDYGDMISPEYMGEKGANYCQLEPEYAPEVLAILDEMHAVLQQTPDGQVLSHNIKEIEPCLLIKFTSIESGVNGTTGMDADGNVEIEIADDKGFTQGQYMAILAHELTHAVDLIKNGGFANTFDDCVRVEKRALKYEALMAKGLDYQGFNKNTLAYKFYQTIDIDNITQDDIIISSDCHKKYIPDCQLPLELRTGECKQHLLQIKYGVER